MDDNSFSVRVEHIEHKFGRCLLLLQKYEWLLKKQLIEHKCSGGDADDFARDREKRADYFANRTF